MATRDVEHAVRRIARARQIELGTTGAWPGRTFSLPTYCRRASFGDLRERGAIGNGCGSRAARCRAGIDADPARIPPGVVSGMLQRVPGELEEDPLLRISDAGVARRHAEERRVEQLDIGKDAVHRDVALVRAQRLRDSPPPSTPRP